MSELFPSVGALLGAHGIDDAPEYDLAHDGFSGARLTTIDHPGARFVLKRIRYEDDWIMRETNDTALREAQVAVSRIIEGLPSVAAVPSLGAAHDGPGAAILMRDVSPWLLPGDRPASKAQTDALLSAMAAMHVAFWERPLDDAAISWCDPRKRLLILSPEVGAKLLAAGHDFGVDRGWRAFARHAAPEARILAERMFEDPAPLLAVAALLPQTLLHGDIKFANIAIDERRVWLFDWALVMHGPVALDLSWFPAVNTPQIPWSVEDTLERYGQHLHAALGARRFAEADWPRQRAIAAIRTLMLMGWAKALDHEAGRPHELAGLCGRALAGAKMLGL